MVLLPTAVVGGIAGGLLLLNTSERIFREVNPFSSCSPPVCSPFKAPCANGSSAAPNRWVQPAIICFIR
jgi:hypothetical protein